MDVRSPLALALAAAALAFPAPAGAQFAPGGATPGACAGSGFTDHVGTAGVDLVTGAADPQRLYGLAGDDWLAGSPSRATCVFGGDGDDMLALGAAGGVVLGEAGADVLVGSEGDDGLAGGAGPDVVDGRGGADVLRGGDGLDLVRGGTGDDLLDTADGVAELVDCGAGADTAIADGVDVVVSCERGQQAGPRLRFKHLLERRGGPRTTFRMRFVAPRAAGAGGYRVYVAGSCDDRLREAAVLAAPVRRGQETRLRLRAPEGGWCRGVYGGTIVRIVACPPRRTCQLPRPPEPLALIAFEVR